MKKDDLIQIWDEGNDRLFRDEKTDRNMITQYLNEKTIKGNRNINFNLVFYGIIQLANLVLISMNLASYSANSNMVWILIPQIAFSIATLIFGLDIFLKFRQINNYSDSLLTLIKKQLWLLRKPYEIWLLLASISAIILISNINFHVDNDNASYVINNKLMYAGVTIGAFIFIYGTQKASSLLGLNRLKAYLEDLQDGVLEKSQKIERASRRYLWLWIAVFILLSASLVFGIITAIRGL